MTISSGVAVRQAKRPPAGPGAERICIILVYILYAVFSQPVKSVNGFSQMLAFFATCNGLQIAQFRRRDHPISRKVTGDLCFACFGNLQSCLPMSFGTVSESARRPLFTLFFIKACSANWLACKRLRRWIFVLAFDCVVFGCWASANWRVFTSYRVLCAPNFVKM